MNKGKTSLQNMNAIVSLFIIVILVLSSILPTLAYAKVEGGAPNKAIEDELYDSKNGMISLTQNDIESFASISSWIQNQHSFIYVRNNDGKISYYFNTPNLQQNIVNMVTRFNPGGWEINTGSDVGFEKDKSEWRTALLKYGYSFPQASYYGETPAVQLDLNGILGNRTNNLHGVVDSVIKGASVVVANIGDLLFGFLNFIGIKNDVDFDAQIADTKPEDFRGLYYTTTDYKEADDHVEKLQSWLEEVWEPLKSTDVKIEFNGKDIFDTDIIVPDGRVVGENFDGGDLLDAIIDKCGSEYETVLVNISNAAENKLGKPSPVTDVTRFMPYDISNMSAGSREYMNNIADPRFETTKGSALFNIDKMFANAFNGLLVGAFLGVVSFLCSLAGFVNSICDMKFLTSNDGLNPVQFWSGSIGQLIFAIILIAALCMLCVNTFKTFVGTHSTRELLSKSVLSLLLIGLSAGIIASPQSFGNTISNVGTKVTSIGSSMLQQSDAYSEYYTPSSTEAERSELRFWYCYFNIWGGVVTSHNAGEDFSKYDPSNGGNEYIDRPASSATLSDDSTIDVWQADLLDCLFNKDDNNALRAVDHFMAPKITPTGGFGFNVEANSNYTSPFYSQIPIAAVLLAFSLLVLAITKFACFIEFGINFILFFLNIARGVVEGKTALLSSVKDIIHAMLKVMFYDILLTIVMLFTDTATGSMLNFISVIIFTALVAFYWYMLFSRGMKDNFPVFPLLFKFIRDLFINLRRFAPSFISDYSDIKEEKKSLMCEVSSNDKSKRESMKTGSNKSSDARTSSNDFSELSEDSKVDNKKYVEDSGRAKDITEQGENIRSAGVVTISPSEQPVHYTQSSNNGTDGYYTSDESLKDDTKDKKKSGSSIFSRMKGAFGNGKKAKEESSVRSEEKKSLNNFNMTRRPQDFSGESNYTTQKNTKPAIQPKEPKLEVKEQKTIKIVKDNKDKRES